MGLEFWADWCIQLAFLIFTLLPRAFFVSVSGVRKGLVVVQSLTHAQLFVTPWTITLQVPLSMGFPGQEYWSGLPSPSPGDLPDRGFEPRFPALQTDSLPTDLQEKPYVCVWGGGVADRNAIIKLCINYTAERC